MKDVMAGIDIGGTNTIFGLVDISGNVIAEGRLKTAEYSDIKDFIKKKPCGPSMIRKLIYIGALDSLMEGKTKLLDKMWFYEETVKQIDFEEKLEELKNQEQNNCYFQISQDNNSDQK